MALTAWQHATSWLTSHALLFFDASRSSLVCPSVVCNDLRTSPSAFVELGALTVRMGSSVPSRDETPISIEQPFTRKWGGLSDSMCLVSEKTVRTCVDGSIIPMRFDGSVGELFTLSRRRKRLPVKLRISSVSRFSVQ